MTLKELFESRKDELAQKLSSLSLPQDAARVQSIVTDYLNNLFDSNGDFRQNLTQSEDYIMQAAMSLLNAQQGISSVLTKELNSNAEPKKLQSTGNQNLSNEESNPNKTNSSYSLIGAAGGALAGKLILGGWGAVFGAIAGVALSIYLSNKNQVQANVQPVSKPIQETISTKTIDVDRFLEIIKSVCESVDNLIETFRAQVNRVVQKYESQDKPTLDKEYRPLIETIQSLVGYERNHDITEEKYSKKLQERIEVLVESLDSYNIVLENYSEDKAQWFEVVASPNTKELKEVYPAVVKNGALIIPGKVFVPA
ncbi:MAG: hypothetical protein IKH26_05850 [Bacteroidaceae bacterium]|nr:hypothetical protein [Bacteroidaceae bacterium]